MSVKISAAVIECLQRAESKALASFGSSGINVVPVSMVNIHDETIWLFDFFMDKTVTNVHDNPQVALAAWSGMKGVQITGEVAYITSGAAFDQAVAWVAEQNPDRVVRGLLELRPTAVYDVSPGGAFAEDDLSLA